MARFKGLTQNDQQKKKYQKYNAKRTSKAAYFRNDNEQDMILYRFAGTFDFTNWVKRKLKEEMKK